MLDIIAVELPGDAEDIGCARKRAAGEGAVGPVEEDGLFDRLAIELQRDGEAVRGAGGQRADDPPRDGLEDGVDGRPGLLRAEAEAQAIALQDHLGFDAHGLLVEMAPDLLGAAELAERGLDLEDVELDGLDGHAGGDNRGTRGQGDGEGVFLGGDPGWQGLGGKGRLGGGLGGLRTGSTGRPLEQGLGGLTLVAAGHTGEHSRQDRRAGDGPACETPASVCKQLPHKHHSDNTDSHEQDPATAQDRAIGRRTLRIRAILARQHQVVAVHGLLVRSGAEGLGDLRAAKALDLGEFLRGVVHQAAGQLAAFGADDLHDVAALEPPAQAHHADRQEAPVARDQGLDRAGIDLDLASRPGDHADPAIAGGHAVAGGHEDRAQSLADQKPQDHVLGPAIGDGGDGPGIGDHAHGLELGRHAARAQLALAAGHQGEDVLIDGVDQFDELRRRQAGRRRRSG